MATKLCLNSGIALVTGAASGLGQETAFAFAEAGVKGIVFADINEDGAKEFADTSKKYARNAEYRVVAVKVDITDEASVQNMVDVTVKEFGRIDYNVNSAGLCNLSGAVTPDLKFDIFMTTIETRIKGTMLYNRAVTKSRHGTWDLGRGSIINVGSVNTCVAAPGMMPYTTSKHALIGLTKSAGIDSLKSHIRVNTVCPSWIDTPMMQASLQRVPALAQIIKAVSPLQGAATTEEVADCIVFLCSPSASYINGTGLPIDAGATSTAHVG